MKVINKGVEILYYKNGDKKYMPFVIWDNTFPRTKEYATTYSDYSLYDRNGAVLFPFDSEEKGLEKLNRIVSDELRRYKEIEDRQIIRTEIKYINESN